MLQKGALGAWEKSETVSWGWERDVSQYILVYGWLWSHLCFVQIKEKFEQEEEDAIQKIENKLKQKNLIMYQVGDKTPGRKALFPVT